jgi:hypothetical protein
VTESSTEEPQAYLEGDEAARWFFGERGGDFILDRHLSLMQATFGREVPYRLRAEVDPLTRKPKILIIEILLPVDDEDAWRLLVDLEQRLLSELKDLRSATATRFPFRRIAVSLAGEPSRWADIVDAVERAQ